MGGRGTALRAIYVQWPHVDLRVQNADGSWNLPMPGTFVLDEAGVVRARHVDPDYQVRMEPTAVLAALDTLRD